MHHALDHLEILCNTHPNNFDRNDAPYRMTHTLDEFFVDNPDPKAVMARLKGAPLSSLSRKVLSVHFSGKSSQFTFQIFLRKVAQPKCQGTPPSVLTDIHIHIFCLFITKYKSKWNSVRQKYFILLCIALDQFTKLFFLNFMEREPICCKCTLNREVY